jgi:hypothetical protein
MNENIVVFRRLREPISMIYSRGLNWRRFAASDSDSVHAVAMTLLYVCNPQQAAINY